MPAAIGVALLLTTAILWAEKLPLTTGGALAILAVAGAGAWWRGGLRALVLVVLAGLPVVATLMSAAHQLGVRQLADGPLPDVLVSGAVCEFPRVQPGSWRFVLDTDPEFRALGVPPRVLVSWYDADTRPTGAPRPGDRWQLSLRLRSPRGLSNPGTFDYERWLFAQHIGATGWVRESGANARLTGGAAVCPAAGWRAATAQRIGAILGDRASAPYVLGMAIGAYQALPEQEWDKLRRTGTIHLISISGFHIALVAAPAALLGLGLARVWLALGRRCRPRVLAAWTAVLAASAYGFLAGFSVPTARSVVGIVVVALLATRRRAVTLPELLSCVVLCVLLIEPLAPLVQGFWLSFAGVLILAVVALGLPSGGTGRGPVRLLVETQVAMTVGLAPLLILFFGQLPASGALANLVAVPAFSIVLLPLTLAGTAAAWLAPSVGALLLGLAADCFDAWRWFLGWCADLPFAVWYLPEPSPGAALLGVAGSVVLLWPAPWPGRWLGFAMFTGLLASGVPPVPEGGVRLTVLDVGQGLAVVAQTAGHALLYDTGPAFRNSDAGERVVVPSLQALGVRRLDTLLISHADADHRGGAASVIERHRSARLLGPVPDAAGAAPCQAGRAWQWDGVLFEVLHPAAGAAPKDDNAGSCVVRITTGSSRLLLPGDIEAPVERQLAAIPGFGAVDLVVAPHHGSRTSSSGDFVAVTRPRYVIVSAGYRNRWNFPAGEVVTRWRQSGACVLNTAEQGAMQFVAGARSGLRMVRAERAAAPGIWLARPAAGSPCR